MEDFGMESLFCISGLGMFWEIGWIFLKLELYYCSVISLLFLVSCVLFYVMLGSLVLVVLKYKNKKYFGVVGFFMIIFVLFV